MMRRQCQSGRCYLDFNGSQECIFFCSKYTAVGYEIGWDFVSLVLAGKMSFSAFCDEMTRYYQTNHIHSAKFLCRTTFLKWWFSWVAAMKIDFRTSVQGCCGYQPKLLAADGTHVGVSKLHETLDHPITEVDMFGAQSRIKPLHKR